MGSGLFLSWLFIKFPKPNDLCQVTPWEQASSQDFLLEAFHPDLHHQRTTTSRTTQKYKSYNFLCQFSFSIESYQRNLRWRSRPRSCGSSSTSLAPRWWSPRLEGKKVIFHSMWSSSNWLIWWYHVIIRVSGEILEQKGDVGGKCCDIILQIWFFVIVILRAMPQNYWYLGWWCTIHSIHCTFELARGSITDLSDTCKKFIGGWLDDQMEKFARYFPTRPPATATIWIWMSRRSPPLSLSKVYPGTNVKQGKSTITNMENRYF